MKKCEICTIEFEPKNLKRPTRTCSKECKNILARQTTVKQFSDPAAREIQRKKSLEQKKDPAYQAKVSVSMKLRTERWTANGHPRIGMKHPAGTAEKIGNSNRGRFKGKTWDEIFGKETADRRRLENSFAMSKSNEVLLKERRSSLEDRVLPFLPNYENNIQISYYNVDFINKQTNHVIEIYGDYWHCNPQIYADDFMHPYFKITAIEKRKLDEQRQLYLESLGYTVRVVWESDLEEYIKTLTC
jgi:very-short-patch-repair endonuclease